VAVDVPILGKYGNWNEKDRDEEETRDVYWALEKNNVDLQEKILSQAVGRISNSKSYFYWNINNLSSKADEFSQESYHSLMKKNTSIGWRDENELLGK